MVWKRLRYTAGRRARIRMHKCLFFNEFQYKSRNQRKMLKPMAQALMTARR